MRLIRLELENFRQHAATTLHFPEGLIGVIGPNGAGKSTLLEAVGWCLYGAGAARGTNETIRFTKAPGGSRVRAELLFEMGGHEYRVVRSLSAADVFLDGEPTPVATTIGGVTDYLRRQLGMTREEFFNTYFTGQKELQFLAQLGPAQRARFLNQVLGYERLRAAQDRVRARRSELRHETLGLKAGLPDPGKLEEERERAEAALAEAGRVRAAAEETLAAAEARLAAVRPRWEKAQADRDRDRELLHAAEMADRELVAAEREVAAVEAELARIAAAETELAPLRGRLEELPALQAECERLAELARAAERRRGLEVTEGQLAADVAQEAARLEALATAPEYLARTQAEVEEHEAEVAAAEAELRVLNDAWVQRRQEIETKLRTYHDSYRELKAKIEQLREAGPEGTCPTCERPLEDHFETVVAGLEDERFRMTQDGKWLRQRAEQLQEKPEELRAAEARRAALAEEGGRLARKLTRCEAAVQEQGRLHPEHARREQRLAEVRAELAALSTDYDPARHRAAEARLGELRAVDTQAGGLARMLEGRPERERQRAEGLARVGRAREASAAAAAARATLGFAQAEFEAARVEHAAAELGARHAEVAATEARERERATEQRLEAARRAVADYQERRARLGGLELELRHHNELDSAFSELRTELNDRVRPELSELASAFLADITDGRYTAVELDESYDILVLDEGEEKPVISGGEEDVANLVLRLAISQMIAERAGRPLSILVLDEVFGSLDLQRQDSVVQLLRALGDRFRQVILVTHVEGIREGMDHVIRVSFDERTGASLVVEEDPHAVPAAPLLESVAEAGA